jgi:hypothetical protein
MPAVIVRNIVRDFDWLKVTGNFYSIGNEPILAWEILTKTSLTAPRSAILVPVFDAIQPLSRKTQVLSLIFSVEKH